jgi:hypothetical protein
MANDLSWSASMVSPRQSLAAKGLTVATFFISTMLPSSSMAWVFPEHVDITRYAIQQLEEDQLKLLRDVWIVARGEQGWASTRFCGDVLTANAIYDRSAENSWCIGFAALPAIAGDHSCSHDDLVRILSSAAWLPDVLANAQAVRAALLDAGTSIHKHLNVRRAQHIDLQIADEEYGTRAAGNNAHHQLARDGHTLDQYLRQALESGQAANPTALYANYHAAALDRAGRLAAACDPTCGKHLTAIGDELRSILLTEAMALHFLQDSFSAGHIVGAWGNEAERMGTHDYYSGRGIAVDTWKGDSYRAYGDAFMTAEDMRHSADAVRLSLNQLLNTLAPALNRPVRHAMGPRAVSERRIFERARWDVDACVANRVPFGIEALAESSYLRDVIEREPRPGSRSPHLSRFSAEFGGFVGYSLAVDPLVLGASVKEASDITWIPLRGRAGIRAGFALESVQTRDMDAQLFAEFILGAERTREDSISGVGFRVHMPFAVVPFDLPVWALVAFLTRESWAVRLVKHAAAGSIYWHFQRPILLGEHVSFQISAFRDATFVWYHSSFVEGERRRFEILAPLASLSFGHVHSGRLATDFDVEIGFQYMRLPEVSGARADTLLGGYLSFGPVSRYYP